MSLQNNTVYQRVQN